MIICLPLVLLLAGRTHILGGRERAKIKIPANKKDTINRQISEDGNKESLRVICIRPKTQCALPDHRLLPRMHAHRVIEGLVPIQMARAENYSIPAMFG